MMWWAKVLWDYRKLAIFAMLAIAASVLWWRVHEWRQAYKELPTVKAALDAERACALNTACHERAAKLAEQARLEAEERNQDALSALQAREAKARADASAWRKRYEAALRDEPECAEWASRPVVCPVN